MNQHSHHTKTSENTPAAGASEKQKTDALLVPDSQQQATAQLFEAMYESPQVKQFNACQQMANDNPQTKQLKNYQAMADNYVFQKKSQQQTTPVVQQKENATGLPDTLKSGVENLSGIDISDVKVHYNSAQPAQLNALAYAQGTDIHIAPGQEKHLPHEAWHVVQQKQGRVQATKQMKTGIAINDDSGLEREADVMGAKAVNYTGNTSVPLQQTKNPGQTIQRVTAEGVATFFRQLKQSGTTTLNLYTHVMADGVGDAGLIGHLHEKITAEMANYNLTHVNTYLAVEKFVPLDVSGVWEDEHEDADIVAFSTENEYINTQQAQYKNLVSALSHAPAQNIVWSVTTQERVPRKPEGRQASPIPDGWEIQYPVPASPGEEGQKLKIKEMGIEVLDGMAKTGEANEGIGYGIPELNTDINLDEQAVLDEATQHTNLNNAWLSSIKPRDAGVNPLLNVLRAANRDGTGDTLVYLPGTATIETTVNYAVATLINRGGITLARVTIDGGTVYTITGTFRNPFLQHRMNSIRNGLILSGGEGLYSESLGIDDATENVASIMAPRYNYQVEEVARALAQSGDGLQTQPVNRYANGSLAHSDIFMGYGVLVLNGITYTYNQAANNLRRIHGAGNIAITNEPAGEPVDQVNVSYSDRLSSLYFPMSLNTNAFAYVPAHYNFETAKRTFAQERTRLKQDANWFDIISSVGQEVVAQALAQPLPQQVVHDEAENDGSGAVADSKCCYITTACVLTQGLPDDCEELMILRQLRDNYILKKPEGKKLVKLYYDHAPAIVLAINRRDDYFEFYKKLYKIIRRCVDLTLNKEFEAAYTIYCYMVHRLKEDFLPGVEIRL